MFDSTGEDSQPKILLTKFVPVSLLTYPEYSQPNKNRYILALVMQFVKAASDMAFFRFGARNIQFSRVVFEINQLFKIQGHVSITDSENKYLKILNFYIC